MVDLYTSKHFTGFNVINKEIKKKKKNFFDPESLINFI